MSWRFRKRIRRQEPSEPWQWAEPEPPDNWKKDLLFVSLMALGLMAAEFAYCWLVTPAHNFRFDLGFWLMLLFPNFMVAGFILLTIRELWSWLRKTAAKLKAGKTTILDVIVTVIFFLIAAWFFGSAGMRFISQ